MSLIATKGVQRYLGSGLCSTGYCNPGVPERIQDRPAEDRQRSAQPKIDIFTAQLWVQALF